MKRSLLSLAAWAARSLPKPLKRAIYSFKPLAKFIRGSLNIAAPQGLTRVKVAAGDLAGVEMTLDLQSEKDYWLGTYEMDIQAAIQSLVRPGCVAYDVGANIGYISLLLARRVGPGGQVFAFEALPANVDRLKQNLETSGLAARVQVVHAAVIDETRDVQFYVGPSGGMGKAEGSAGRQEYAYQQVVLAPGLSLDHFVYQQGNPAPQVVKMDIEGGEVLALPGMRRVLAEARPLMLLEMHGPEAARVAWETLRGANYRICRMANGYPQVSELSELDWKAYLVAIPEELS